ncbi:MAG: heme-binding protein [Bdellovibrionales bacterium]|nr:heme-binding protein [Bdellovibrionales bacterium]
MKISFENSTISRQAAELLIETAIRTAENSSLNISVCILDSSGRMKAFSSMDNAPAVSLETCIKKAKTAVGFGIPTGKAWYEFIKNDPILHAGAQHLPDFILLGGGSPILYEGRLIGAIGVSGGHYEQDEKCVAAALEKLNSTPS